MKRVIIQRNMFSGTWSVKWHERLDALEGRKSTGIESTRIETLGESDDCEKARTRHSDRTYASRDVWREKRCEDAATVGAISRRSAGLGTTVGKGVERRT